jgi:hypothetical protein
MYGAGTGTVDFTPSLEPTNKEPLSLGLDFDEDAPLKKDGTPDKRYQKKE